MRACVCICVSVCVIDFDGVSTLKQRTMACLRTLPRFAMIPCRAFSQVIHLHLHLLSLLCSSSHKKYQTCSRKNFCLGSWHEGWVGQNIWHSRRRATSDAARNTCARLVHGIFAGTGVSCGWHSIACALCVGPSRRQPTSDQVHSHRASRISCMHSRGCRYSIPKHWLHWL